MSTAAWSAQFAGGPYAERADPEPSRLDDVLLRAQGRLAPLLRARRVARLARIADGVDALAGEFSALSDRELRVAAAQLRAQLLRAGLTPAMIARAFALTREATHRQLRMRHHRVQLMGGAAMLGGALAEMETGEGKTITALLPSVAVALMGRPVHVVTVNEYLAERDADQLRPVFAALGLSVGLAKHGQSPPDRRAAYACDVTYCTNKDVVFDYLRDRMALGQRRSRARLQVDALCGLDTAPLLLRGLHYALIDEADSVLIDEARTPLILSGMQDSARDTTLYHRALALAQALVSGPHFEPEPDGRPGALTPEGKALLRDRAKQGENAAHGLLQSRRAREELVSQALHALHSYRLDRHYIVADGKVQIVDEYTGRVMADRTWQRGLHQLIEAKEGCEVTGERRVQASITYQRFFRRYLRLAGMSGTVGESAGELRAVYGLDVVRIPTHRALRRRYLRTRIFATSEAKWRTVAARVAEVTAGGQSVLIGTRSVAASEEVSRWLATCGFPQHEVLNARQDKREAEIVAQAGRRGHVTVATNMAGRGTDIRPAPEVIAAGGLHVIVTEFHESARIDRQLYGRSARQGDPGSVEAIVSLEDDLFLRSLWRSLLRLTGILIRAFPDGRAARRAGDLLRRLAQYRAERRNAQARRATVARDKRLDQSLAFAGRSE
jgi:preprotein translocase subunit SecA